MNGFKMNGFELSFFISCLRVDNGEILLYRNFTFLRNNSKDKSATFLYRTCSKLSGAIVNISIFVKVLAVKCIISRVKYGNMIVTLLISHKGKTLTSVKEQL